MLCESGEKKVKNHAPFQHVNNCPSNQKSAVVFCLGFQVNVFWISEGNISHTKMVRSMNFLISKLSIIHPYQSCIYNICMKSVFVC